MFLLSCLSIVSSQKFREYLEGSNLITKLQAKHDLLKRTLGDGIVCLSFLLPFFQNRVNTLN